MAVRKRGKSWMIDFYYKDQTGQELRFRRTTGPGLTKTQANHLERQWRAEIDGQSSVPVGQRSAPVETPAAPTTPVPAESSQKRAAFSGFAKHWYDLHVQNNNKPTQARAVEQTLRCHLVPFFGDRDLRKITAEDLERYKATKARSLAAKSVNNHLGILGRMFRSAIEWDYCERNPARATQPLRLPPADLAWWQATESDTFLRTVRKNDPDWYPFFLCALRTGMRLGELVALRWADVDFERGSLHVGRSWSHGHETTPKSGRSRTLPLSPELSAALSALRAKPRGLLVFCGEDGGRLDRNKVKHPFWRNVKEAGVRLIRLHDLRHSFASQLVSAGVNLRVVQDLLGHADIKMTMRYAHLAPEERVEVVAKLDGLGHALGHKMGTPAATGVPGFAKKQPRS